MAASVTVMVKFSLVCVCVHVQIPTKSVGCRSKYLTNEIREFCASCSLIHNM